MTWTYPLRGTHFTLHRIQLQLSGLKSALRKKVGPGAHKRLVPQNMYLRRTATSTTLLYMRLHEAAGEISRMQSSYVMLPYGVGRVLWCGRRREGGAGVRRAKIGGNKS